MAQECAILDTYIDATSLAAGLYQHRLDLMNTTDIMSELASGLATRLRMEDCVNSVAALVAEASLPHRLALRKAILAFVEGRQSLCWVLKRTRVCRATSTSTCLASIIPRPSVCEGRDTLIAELTALVTAEMKDSDDDILRCAILYGVGGIGKSTVALEVLHHPDVSRHFKDRFFIECDGLSTLDEFLNHLVLRLDLDTSGRHARIAVHEFFTSFPALLVLDNFEDMCPAGGPADGLEDLLSATSEGGGKGSNMVLLVTKRGGHTLSLRHSRSFALDALDNESAVRAFCRHAQRGESDASLPALVTRLEGHPLAIMLLAHQYSVGATASALMASFLKGQQDLLRRGKANNRQTSLHVSADLSFRSSIMSAPAAKDLCSLLSLLPDGADDEMIGIFVTQAFDRHRLSSITPSLRRRRPWGPVPAKTAVIGAGLASVTSQGLLRMLAPLRELFAPRGYEAGLDARSAMRTRISSLLASSKELFNQTTAQSSATLRIQLTNQLGNMSAVVSAALNSRAQAQIQRAITQAHLLAELIYFTKPFVPPFLIVAKDKARFLGLTEEEAHCWLILGRLQRFTSSLDEAKDSYQQALDLYTEANNTDMRAQTLALLGDVARQQGLVSIASNRLCAALDLSRRLDHPLGQAGALRSLGELAIRQGDLPGARGHFDKALDMFRAANASLGEASTLRVLGRLAYQTEDLSSARQHAGDAFAISQAIGYRIGQAESLALLGRVALKQREPKNARSFLTEALTLFQEAGHCRGEAHVLRLLRKVSRLERHDSTNELSGTSIKSIEQVSGLEVREAEALSGPEQPKEGPPNKDSPEPSGSCSPPTAPIADRPRPHERSSSESPGISEWSHSSDWSRGQAERHLPHPRDVPRQPRRGPSDKPNLQRSRFNDPLPNHSGGTSLNTPALRPAATSSAGTSAALSKGPFGQSAPGGGGRSGSRRAAGGGNPRTEVVAGEERSLTGVGPGGKHFESSGTTGRASGTGRSTKGHPTMKGLDRGPSAANGPPKSLPEHRSQTGNKFGRNKLCPVRGEAPHNTTERCFKKGHVQKCAKHGSIHSSESGCLRCNDEQRHPGTIIRRAQWC